MSKCQVKRSQIGLALVDSVLLAGTTWYMTSLLDGPTNHKATYFLAPYCAWVGFATYLNGGIWWLNRDRTTVKLKYTLQG